MGLFDKPYPISGYDFGTPCPPGGWAGSGTCFGWPVHLGTDVGTPAGTPIPAPAAGVATFETGLVGYGNLLKEKLSSGYTVEYGHVASGISGPVTAGQIIGTTGHDVGSAVGSVTLLQVLDPSGNPINPDPFLQGVGGGLGAIAGGAGAAVGAASSDIAGAIAGIPTQIGHGLADAIGAGVTDVGVFFRRQAVALFVAVVVLIVIFSGNK